MKGQWDYELDPVYSIGILDFIFDDDQSNDHQEDEANNGDDTYLHIVDLKDQDCRVFYEKLRFIYIELPKYTKTIDQIESHQDKWLYLLRHLPDLDDRPSPFQDPVFLELFEVAEIAKFSRSEQEVYERSLKYYRDLNNVVDTSKQVGLEQGIEIGREEGIEIGRGEGIEIGREEEKRTLLLRLLTLKLGDIPEPIGDRLNLLSSDQLDVLSEQFLVFNAIDELMRWLDKVTQK